LARGSKEYVNQSGQNIDLPLTLIFLEIWFIWGTALHIHIQIV